MLPLVSHVGYAPSALLRLVKRQDSQTDGLTPDRYITLSARRGQNNNNHRMRTGMQADPLLKTMTR